MALVLLAPILYVAAVVQTSMVDLVQVGPLAPDLLALTAILWLLTAAPSPWAVLVAGGIGLLEDLISPGRVGFGAISFVLAGYAVARLRGRFRLDHLASRILTVCVAVTLIVLCVAAGRWLCGELAMAPGKLLTRAVGVGVYTAGVSIPVAMVLGWLGQSSRQRERRLAGV